VRVIRRSRTRLATSTEGQSGRVQIPGLSPDMDYRVRIREEIGHPSMHHVAPPAWVSQALRDWITLPGTILTVAGLPMPTLNPEQAILIEAQAVSAAE
jgi:alpha-galactosidase